MSLLGFGGHPILHDYNYKIYRQEEGELLQRMHRERQARRTKRPRWTNRLGTRMIKWGRRLEHFGGSKERTWLSPSTSPHH